MSRPGPGDGFIVVRGAEENNLRSIDVEIPRNAVTVISGPSGSGKSSLAFDTIFAEGQRQYLESLSPFQRRSFDQLPKPRVKTIAGLGPTIAVRQHIPARNPRSTVGTITEISNLIRLLYSRAGAHACLNCGTEIVPRSPEDLVAEGTAAIGDRAARLLSVSRLSLAGDQPAEGDRKVLTRIPGGKPASEITSIVRRRVSNILRDPATVLIAEPDGRPPVYLDTDWTCGKCGRQATATSSQFFSENSPEGMCPACEGLGKRVSVSEASLVADEDVSIRAGALTFYGDRRLEPKKTYWPVRDLPELLEAFGYSLDTVWSSLPLPLREVILHGHTDRPVPPRARAFLEGRTDTGLAPEIWRLYRTAATIERKEFYQRFLASAPCTACRGQRLAQEALAVTLAEDNIAVTLARPISEIPAWLDRVTVLRLPPIVGAAVAEIEDELRRKISDVEEVGLGYLSLNRPVTTLSAGEGQRLRIARALGSTLVDVVYVLDEPSIGLHPADTGRLARSLGRLRDSGNTVIVVEHDGDILRGADYLVDIGPVAGEQGGRVVAVGTPDEVAHHAGSPTAAYLRGEVRFDRDRRRAPVADAELVLEGARLHNLRDVTARFPHGLLTCVTGPSGSGKSSLVTGVLQRAASFAIEAGKVPRGPLEDLRGYRPFAAVVTAAQDPMARNSRSIPATYIGIFDEIRRIFARQPDSVRKRWSTAYFSFNSEHGQCWTCRGTGEQVMELHFLPDVHMQCPRCHGRRFGEEVLQVKVAGYSIADVLDLDAASALRFFAGHRRIERALNVLCDIGLGYLRLGQNAATLSGGEAQRLKLARELHLENRGGPSLYILDEPTSGLHAVDVVMLTSFLHKIVDMGNTVIVIEHNVDVVASADWVIDLGPGSGTDGGVIVAEGTPEDIVGDGTSAMAPFLRRALGH